MRLTDRLIIILIYTLCSCNGQSDRSFIIDNNGVGNLKFCEKISSSIKPYNKVEEMRFEGDEGETWTGKKLILDNDEWIIVESSWLDSTLISRISTNSRKFKTINGYKVGDKISKIIANKDRISFYEDMQGFELISDKFQFGFMIEEEYSQKFYDQIRENNPADFLKYIDSNASITEIILTSDCKN